MRSTFSGSINDGTRIEPHRRTGIIQIRADKNLRKSVLFVPIRFIYSQRPHFNISVRHQIAVILQQNMAFGSLAKAAIRIIIRRFVFT